MPEGVIWSLRYPTGTADQMAIFRHHFETLRLDAHVESISATERPDIPFSTTVQVVFIAGCERPASQELRFLDARYPSRMTHLEQEILVDQSQQPSPPRVFFEPPQIRGMSSEEMQGRFQEVALALRVPIFDMTDNSGTIPEWVKTGRVYRNKTSGYIVTLRRVRVSTEGFEVSCTCGDSALSLSIQDFVNVFEPCDGVDVGAKRPRTAWARVLEEIDGD